MPYATADSIEQNIDVQVHEPYEIQVRVLCFTYMIVKSSKVRGENCHMKSKMCLPNTLALHHIII